MRITRTRLFLWLGLVLAAALLVQAVRPRPVPVDIVAVARGPLRVTLDEEGETRVRERFVVSAPLTGRVLRISLEPGDPVRAGDVVATLQPSLPALLDARTRLEVDARVRAAEAAVTRVEAERNRVRTELTLARSDLERQRELAAAGIAPRERLESAELAVRGREEALRAADAAVTSAAHELDVARASLVQVRAGPSGGSVPMVLTSPIEGVVLRRLRESEALVPAGEPLVELGDPAEIEIVADFLSSDAVQIRPGQRVIVDQYGGDEPLAGRVQRIEPSGFTKISALGVEEQRVNVIVDLEGPSEAAAALGDGYRVEVRVVIWETGGALTVPTSCLFRSGDDWAVFTVHDGRAVLRTIAVGRRNSLEAEVLEGLEEGDAVVAFPSDAVMDGVRIVRRS
jgi:HlyD family secretion protein